MVYLVRKGRLLGSTIGEMIDSNWEVTFSAKLRKLILGCLEVSVIKRIGPG